MTDGEFLKFYIDNLVKDFEQEIESCKKNMKDYENIIDKFSSDDIESSSKFWFYQGFTTATYHHLNFIQFILDALPLKLINELPDLDHPHFPTADDPAQ